MVTQALDRVSVHNPLFLHGWNEHGRVLTQYVFFLLTIKSTYTNEGICFNYIFRFSFIYGSYYKYIFKCLSYKTILSIYREKNIGTYI